MFLLLKSWHPGDREKFQVKKQNPIKLQEITITFPLIDCVINDDSPIGSFIGHIFTESLLCARKRDKG